MRNRAYVDDALAVLSWPPLKNAAEVYRAAREAVPVAANGTP